VSAAGFVRIVEQRNACRPVAALCMRGPDREKDRSREEPQQLATLHSESLALNVR
jgi:hypothetical protein